MSSVAIVEGDCCRRWSEGSFFISYYTKVLGRMLLFSLDCSTLSWIHTLLFWALSKAASSTIFWVFGITRPGIEPWSPSPLANKYSTQNIRLTNLKGLYLLNLSTVSRMWYKVSFSVEYSWFEFRVYLLYCLSYQS